MSRTIIGGIILVVLAVLLLTFGPAMCTSLFSAKKQAEVSKGQGEAMGDAAGEAVNTIGNVMAADEKADQVHKEGIDAIRKAPEGERGDAALAQSCRLRHNQHKQRCASLRQADPGQPPSGR